MKLLGAILILIGIILSIVGAGFILIDSKEEKQNEAILDYHAGPEAWQRHHTGPPNNSGQPTIDFDSIQISNKLSREARAKLKSLRSGDKWWFISGGAAILLGAIFWAFGYEFERLRKAKAD